MSWRTPLIQMIALLGALIVGSFFPIPYLGVILATVRLLLVMELGVALIYLGILIRRQQTQPVLVRSTDDVLYEMERGG
ncbi:MAG TPA: hypothetical protein VFZ66_26965 [Herpetosiphonaceae bacterium]